MDATNWALALLSLSAFAFGMLCCTSHFSGRRLYSENRMDAIAAAMKPKARPQINLDELNEVEMPERSTCAICLEHLELGESAKQLDCEHCFHSECLIAWWSRCISRHGTSATRCPLCRQVQMLGQPSEIIEASV
eukprot:symbB.v1.2.006753.t1/scaffold405.1/size210896/9